MRKLSIKKSIAKLFLSIAVIVCLSAFTPSAYSQSLPPPNVIKSAINTAGAGMCLDVAGGKLAEGTPIVQFGCHSGANQRFIITLTGSQRVIRSAMNPNMCVGIRNNVYANAYDLLRLVPCRLDGDIPLGVRWHQEIFNGNLRFRAVSPSSDRKSTCIDVASGAATPSLWMQLYYCHEGPNQQWRIL